MTPMQWYPEIIEWIVGENYGYQTYVDIIKKFGRQVLPFGMLFDRKN